MLVRRLAALAAVAGLFAVTAAPAGASPVSCVVTIVKTAASTGRIMGCP